MSVFKFLETVTLLCYMAKGTLQDRTLKWGDYPGLLRLGRLDLITRALKNGRAKQKSEKDVAEEEAGNTRRKKNSIYRYLL